MEEAEKTTTPKETQRSFIFVLIVLFKLNIVKTSIVMLKKKKEKRKIKGFGCLAKYENVSFVWENTCSFVTSVLAKETAICGVILLWIRTLLWSNWTKVIISSVFQHYNCDSDLAWTKEQMKIHVEKRRTELFTRNIIEHEKDKETRIDKIANQTFLLLSLLKPTKQGTTGQESNQETLEFDFHSYTSIHSV